MPPGRLTSQVSIRVSRRSFTLWWLSLLLLHGIAGGLIGASAYFYWGVEGTPVDYFLLFYGVNFEVRWYSTIAVLLGLVAFPHAIAIAKMVSASLYYRACTFSFGSVAVRGAQSAKCKPAKRQQSKSQRRKLFVQCPAEVAKLYNFLAGRRGILGVEGKYFHTILFVRELVETTFQTYQAYRMSVYLQRLWLNRFYVALLVLNCWLTPLIHHIYKNHEAKKRLLCLVCDCALDLVSSVVIPCTILVIYYSTFTSEGSFFNMVTVQDEVWFMQVTNELQLLFVVSWRDLASRMVFSLGLAIAMSDVKELVVGVYITNQVNSFAGVVSGPATNLAAATGPSVDTILAATANHEPTEGSPSPHQLGDVPVQSRSSTELRFQHLATLIHGLLVVWGAVVFGLHVFAESHLSLSQCLFQVRPWGEAKHVCSLVLLDCYSSGISGSASEIDAEWQALNDIAATHIQIRHCSALEIPPVLQRFSRLQSLKFYNSTIVEWSDDAAIMTAHHPHLTTLYFIRVDFTDGLLPPGLQSLEFPVTVNDIEFSVTNLRSLPSDLDTRWPPITTLYFEIGDFTSVPEVVVRMKPLFFSVYGNPIQELPSELFEGDMIMFLHVGGTLVTSLPANVTFDANMSSLWYLYVSNTQISYFPEWVDGMATAALVQDRLSIIASDTPYCSQLEQIEAGPASEFVITQPDGLSPLSVLMDPSLESLEAIKRMVSCSPNDGAAFFKLVIEDEQHRIVV